MKVNIVREGIKYGCICGLITVLIQYGSWAAGINTFVSLSFWSNFIPYIIVILLLAGFQIRKTNDGLLPFSSALKFTFLSYVVVAVITACATYVLYNLIDKNLTQKSMQIAMEKTRALMEKFGSSEEDIAKAMKRTEDGSKDTGIGRIFLGTGLFLIWDFIKSLLISLIIRKEEKFSD